MLSNDVVKHCISLHHEDVVYVACLLSALNTWLKTAIYINIVYIILKARVHLKWFLNQNILTSTDTQICISNMCQGPVKIATSFPMLAYLPYTADTWSQEKISLIQIVPDRCSDLHFTLWIQIPA